MKRLLFSTLVVLAVWTAAWATGMSARFTFESVRSTLAGTGPWGLVAFIVAFVTGQLLRVPSFVFVAAAVAVHGRNAGILIAFLGALSSATVSFAVVRTFAARSLADVRHPFMQRLLAHIHSRPVRTVALLRLLFQTAPPLNYALPMTAVHWRDHLVGSVLGLPVPIVVMAFFVDWLLHGRG